MENIVLDRTNLNKEILPSSGPKGDILGNKKVIAISLSSPGRPLVYPTLWNMVSAAHHPQTPRCGSRNAPKI